jgi:Skp family chaperone for outer membrane proteins
MKKFNLILIIILFFANISLADQYPNTSIGIIDINRVLTESNAAKDAAKQIEKIQNKSEEDSKKEDELIIKEREKLIEQQSVMAPEAFEVKVADFEKKVQTYQIERQEKLRKLDRMVQAARANILDEVKPIINDYATELGITVILEKNAVVMSADDMDMTDQDIEIKVELKD